MQNKAAITALIKTASIFVLLIAVTLVYFAQSFGWFAKNEGVDANGMSASVEGVEVEITAIESSDGEVTIDPDFSVAIKDLCPSDTAKVQITITCYKQVEALSVSLIAPENCDTPVSVDGANYYMGSQILIQSLTYNGQPVSNGAIGKSLFGSNPADLWGTTELVTPTDISLYSFSPLTVGSHVFEIEFLFYNATYNQNVLKNFGQTEGQTCYRKFKIG